MAVTRFRKVSTHATVKYIVASIRWRLKLQTFDQRVFSAARQMRFHAFDSGKRFCPLHAQQVDHHIFVVESGTEARTL